MKLEFKDLSEELKNKIIFCLYNDLVVEKDTLKDGRVVLQHFGSFEHEEGFWYSFYVDWVGYNDKEDWGEWCEPYDIIREAL